MTGTVPGQENHHRDEDQQGPSGREDPRSTGTLPLKGVMSHRCPGTVPLHQSPLTDSTEGREKNV